MSGKLAFAVFVAALFALPRFMVIQAHEAHLQPRDTLPTQNNSTQDHVLPRVDLASAPTYLASGAKLKRILVARDEPASLKIRLTKSSTQSQYTGKITVKLQYTWKDFHVVFSTVAQGNLWLVSTGFHIQSNKRRFDHTFNNNGLPPRHREKSREFKVNAFGGKGTGREYMSMTKIGQVNLGITVVGSLQEIEGFEGEIGDGVVPLARNSYDKAQHTIWQKLIGPKGGRARVMAFALRLSEGELHIGMIDDRASDDIQYYKCVSSPFWEIHGVSIHVGKDQVPGQRIIFDTTSQFIRGPGLMVAELYEKMKGYTHTEFHAELGLYEIPCGSEVNIGLHLGHEWMMIDPEFFSQRMPTSHDNKCFGLLAAHTRDTAAFTVTESKITPTRWVIGYTAMLYNYMVFNADDDTIGIGKLKKSWEFSS